MRWQMKIYHRRRYSADAKAANYCCASINMNCKWPLWGTLNTAEQDEADEALVAAAVNQLILTSFKYLC